MCNNSNCSHDETAPWDFSDLEDESFTGRAPITDKPLPTLTPDEVAFRSLSNASVESRKAAAGHRYEERCTSCRGSGRFVSYSGRTVGDCFKCKGAGKLTFKTSPEERAKAADARDRAADRKAAELTANVERFKADHADAYDWMVSSAPRFEFAASMLEALTKWGRLTEKQFAAVERCVVRDAERKAQRAAEAAERNANAPVVTSNRIAAAFAHAQGKGVKRPRMTLDGFKISLAPLTGRNAGALYVVRKEDDLYLGKIADGRFMRVRDCDDATEAHVVRIINDPKGEAIAYGQRTGNCCICNRELTNHASIDAGIGPICAERFGW